jgi:hypothetical protein
MPRKLEYTCRMTVYNYDLEVKWKLKNNTVDLLEVRILYSHHVDLLKFLSKEVIKAIIDHINFYELGLPK